MALYGRFIWVSPVVDLKANIRIVYSIADAPSKRGSVFADGFYTVHVYTVVLVVLPTTLTLLPVLFQVTFMLLL